MIHLVKNGQQVKQIAVLELTLGFCMINATGTFSTDALEECKDKSWTAKYLRRHEREAKVKMAFAIR